MRKILILMVLLQFELSGYSKVGYETAEVFRQGTIWKVMNIVCGSNMDHPLSTSESYIYMVIDGEAYYSDIKCMEMYCTQDPESQQRDLMGYVYVDGEKVWIASSDNSDSWRILYDFDVPLYSYLYFSDPPISFNGDSYDYRSKFYYIGNGKYERYGDYETMDFKVGNSDSFDPQNVDVKGDDFMLDAIWIRGIGSLGGHTCLAHTGWCGLNRYLCKAWNGDEVFYEHPTLGSTDNIHLQKFKIEAHEGVIRVSGCDKMDTVNVFNVCGQKVSSGQCNTYGEYESQTLTNGIYVVNVGGTAKKIAIH